jgi:uncharacterized protein involved in exopolysaccharide biosynthesis
MLNKEEFMADTHRSKRFKRSTLIIITILGLGLLAGTAYAAMRTIQLNSAATFPVDI